MRLRVVVLALAWLTCAACHPRPVVGGNANPSVGGTIAGVVSTEANTPVAGRRVIATNTATGERYEASTGVNGGYTIKVPQGKYRLEVVLLSGESLAKQPEETEVNSSDLDARRDFVIANREP